MLALDTLNILAGIELKWSSQAYYTIEKKMQMGENKTQFDHTV